MTKTKKPKDPRDGELDWTSLFAAFQDAFEWALDVAIAIARDYPEEVEAVERVRTFMRARIAGDMSHVRVDDILFTFGLLMAAIERDLGPIGANASALEPPLQLRVFCRAQLDPHVSRRLHAVSHITAA